MSPAKRASFLYVIIFLVFVGIIASSYNSSVRKTVGELYRNDKEVLQTYNNDIIKKLSSKESTDDWQKAIEEYDELYVCIENSNNEIVAEKFKDKHNSTDARYRSAFEYKGEAYLLSTSIYIFRDFNQSVPRYYVIEALLILASIVLIFLLMYTIMLRPFRRFYMLIEEYDTTGKFGKYKFRGYIGKVYERFVLLTNNLESQQDKDRRIIASISHDIKTPLTSIMGYSERLQKDNISPERQERYLETIYNKSLEIRSLVDEFDEYLDYNLLRESDIVEISTQDIYSYIVSEYSEELEGVGVRLTVECEEKKSFIRIDTAKIKRVIGNIIGNSLKHFDKDEKKIDVKITSDRKKVFISFSDNGEGVEPEKFDLIFEPLYTSDKGRKVSGLGLAICRDIIERHGGSIAAKSSSMGGLEIDIELDKESVFFG